MNINKKKARKKRIERRNQLNNKLIKLAERYGVEQRDLPVASSNDDWAKRVAKDISMAETPQQRDDRILRESLISMEHSMLYGNPWPSIEK